MSVFLLHPIGLDHRCWSFMARNEWRSLDLPGYGGQPRIPDVTLSAAADAVAELIPDQTDLVGASLGGIVAQHLALRHPGKVRSLVVACTTASLDREVMRSRAQTTLTMSTDEFVADTLERWFGEFQGLAGASAGVAYARDRLIDCDRPLMASYWTAMANHDVRDLLGKLDVPTTILGGYQDVAAPASEVLEMAMALPTSRLELIAGPHMTQLTFPAQFARCIDTHLEWAAAGDRRDQGS